MKVIRTIDEMKHAVSLAIRPIGFVPTMGALHEGHLSLIRAARAENPTVVVSIFVNPTQFGPREDYEKYPRDLDRDLRLLEQEQVDLVFVPDVQEMYPPGFDTWVDPGKIGTILEGAARPGHFRGVDTVVLKLFNICKPDKAYFGQKDGQQCVVIKRMVRDLNLDVEIVIRPTVREPDGLAMSSRNQYLNPEERRAATVISRALFEAEKQFKVGERSAAFLKDLVYQILRSEPLIQQIDYVSVADADTLEELETVDRKAMISTAVRIGPARLIDNVVLDPHSL